MPFGYHINQLKTMPSDINGTDFSSYAGKVFDMNPTKSLYLSISISLNYGVTIIGLEE